MSEIHSVIVTICHPTPGKQDDHGQVTNGFYKLEGELLTMTDGDGTPMRKPNGDFYTHKLRAGENHNIIARVLTMEVWRMVHGKTKGDTSGTGFNRPLNYPSSGVA